MAKLINKDTPRELIELILGSIIYAISVPLFIDPLNIIPGSVTGVAVIIKALTGLPIGVMSILINIPLIILGFFKIGKKLLVYTIIAILTTSGLIDLMSTFNPFTSSAILASIFGGAIMGIGLGLILKSGGTTGGTTVLGRIVNQKYPNLLLGNILLIGDFIIILCGSILLRDGDLLLLSLVNLYACVVFINKVMYTDTIRSINIISSKNLDKVRSTIKSSGKESRNFQIDDENLLMISKKSDLSRISNQLEQEMEDIEILSLDTDLHLKK